MYVWAIWAPNIKNESIVAFLSYLIAKKLCFKKQNKKNPTSWEANVESTVVTVEAFHTFPLFSDSKGEKENVVQCLAVLSVSGVGQLSQGLVSSLKWILPHSPPPSCKLHSAAAIGLKLNCGSLKFSLISERFKNVYRVGQRCTNV